MRGGYARPGGACRAPGDGRAGKRVGVFRDGPAKYARMLGAAGLARYRELLANTPARQHGQDALWTSLHRAEKAHTAD